LRKLFNRHREKLRKLFNRRRKKLRKLFNRRRKKLRKLFNRRREKMSEFKIKDYDSSLQLHNEEEFPFLSLPCSPAPENCFKVFDSPLYEVAPKQAKRKTSPTAKEYPLEFKTRPQILFPFDEPQPKSLLQEDKMESKQEDDEHVNHNEIQLAAEKGHEEAQQQEVEQHESTRNNKAGDSYTNEEA
jgi:hypothetical protein